MLLYVCGYVSDASLGQRRRYVLVWMESCLEDFRELEDVFDSAVLVVSFKGVFHDFGVFLVLVLALIQLRSHVRLHLPVE